MIIRTAILFFLLETILFTGFAQKKVGLVLSGGGADALAHVGVLKALEENNIEISYITGTSVGAFVGAMYASGYTVEEIEQFVSSSTFVNVSTGVKDGRKSYIFNAPHLNASMFNISISGDSSLNTSIPTNVINSSELDFSLLKIFGPSTFEAQFNFDSLYIPFRCVATDIYNNEAVIFSTGNLHTAVRASMTYPFYIRPIEVNGALLFDGGLLDNLPVDIMQKAFAPDFIIASNVGEPAIPPKADDLYSQLKNLIQLKSDYTLQGSEGILIEPTPNVGLFGFENAKAAIDSGYTEAVVRMAEIQEALGKSVSKYSSPKSEVRDSPKSKNLEFNSIKTELPMSSQSSFVKKRLSQKKCDTCTISLDQLEHNYYRLTETSGFTDVFPKMKLDEDSNLIFIYAGERKRNLRVEFGGNVSSRPISTGYVGLKYSTLRKTMQQYNLSTYFGKLYTGARLEAVYEFSSQSPISIAPNFTLHQWDYFESRFKYFLVAERPSYLIQREQYGGIDIRFAQGLSSVFQIKAEGFQTVDDYYQTSEFSAGDTADRSRLEGASFALEWESRTLNQKQLASRGAEYTVRVRGVLSQESYFPGSTSNSEEVLMDVSHNWIQAFVRYQQYFMRDGFFKFGLNVEGFYSTQGAFQNYSATMARAATYAPIPESKTLFLESFRANQYVSSGLQILFDATKRIDVRLESYVFQPIEEIISSETNKVTFGEPFEKRYFLNSGSLVYQSPLGPVSLSVNYYYNQPEISPENKEPISIFFNFGYIITNRKALD